MNVLKLKLIQTTGLMFVGIYAVALGLSSMLVQAKNISSQCLTSLKGQKKRQVERRSWDV